jgi:hypothetical protein
LKNNFIQRSILENLKSEEFFLALLWTAPVCLKLLSIQENIISLFGIAIFIFCLIKIIFRPFYVLVALPFLTLLSPMLGFFEILGSKILLSDIFLLLLVIQMFVLIFKKKNQFNNFKFNKYFVLFSGLFFFGLIFGKLTEYISSFKPILYFIQLFVIYYYTINYTKNDLNKQKTITAWMFACILACFILIKAFLSGQNLQNVLMDENFVIEDKSKLQNLFQATYYYSGFIFLVGLSALVLLLKFFLIGTRLKKLLYLLVFSLFFITLILINNKTVIYSFLLVLMIIIGSLISIGYINRRKFFITLGIFIVILLFVIGPLILNFVDEKQFELMIGRFSSAGSLFIRFEIYHAAFVQWISNPTQILVGVGPDFLDASGVPAKALKFKTSLVTGFDEGTVDSGWISYLIELGIFSFSILVALFYKATKAAYQRFKFQNKLLRISPIGIYVYACLLFMIVTLSTQMLGYTKTSWFPFQLLLFGLMFSIDNKNIKMKNNI